MTEKRVGKVWDKCKRIPADGIEVLVEVGDYDVLENIHGLLMDVISPLPELLAYPPHAVDFCGGTDLSKTNEGGIV